MRRVPVFRSRPGPFPFRRLVHLYAGLVLYGATSALVVRAGFGLEPWDVLHQGIARHTGISIGTVSVLVGAVLLPLWWPLRQRPGLGTVSNVFVVGVTMNATLSLVPAPHPPAARTALLATAIVLNGVATGLYISARFGPGPRDGLMTGLHRHTGSSIRLVRGTIEVTVLVTGILLGGSFGVGTVAYALAIGPLAQLFLRVFALPAPGPAVRVAGSTAGSTAGARGAAAAPVTPRPSAPAPAPAAEPEPRRAILPR